MKKVIVFALAIVFGFASFSFAQTVPADKLTINLKEAWGVKGSQKPVIFKHTTHIAALNNNCAACHSSPQGATKIKVENIKGTAKSNGAHNFCWSCHDKTPKPNKTPGKTCTKCHSGK